MNPRFIKSRFFIKKEQWSGVLHQFGRNPRFDWRTVLTVFILLNIASASFHLFFYERVGSGEVFLVEKQEQVTRRTLNRFKLEETVARLERRRESFEEFLRRPLPLSDPYIPPPAPKKK